MARKKIKDLSIRDFPSLELSEDQLNSWKETHATMFKNQLIFAGVVLSILAVMLVLTGDVFMPGLLVVLLIQYLIQSKFKKLSKELGITNKLIRQAQAS